MRYNPKRYTRKKPWEFKKKLAAWAITIATLAAIASYALAVTDKSPIGEVTTTIFQACIAYLITYAGASATEKVSRNRHNLDADGNPRNPPDAGGVG